MDYNGEKKKKLKKCVQTALEFNIIFCVTYCTMAERTWKCYRCDLIFKKEDIAYVHSDISGHPLVHMKL